MSGGFLSQIQTQRQMQVLAPQLRQSLELLQVPMLELRTLVRQEMEQNPTLEEMPMEMERIEVEPVPERDEPIGDGGESTAPTETSDSAESSDAVGEDDFDREFDELAKLDDEWREYNQQAQASQPANPEASARRQFLLDSLSQGVSLQQHLMNQLGLATEDPNERQMGELIIGSINDDGYLTTTVEELAQTTGYEVAQVGAMLAMVQEFDPIGVGASDLKECLLLQLRRLGKDGSLPAQIVADHLDDLGARRFSDIARRLKATPEEVQEASRLIATLEPKPGRLFMSDEPAYVLPEVVVSRVGDDYVITLNNDQIPHLHISDHYRQLMASEGTKQDVKSYIREKVRAGMFLIKSIGQRQQTIYNIAREIVRVQRDFLDQGVKHLRPLTMAEIAGVLGIHETTVSRAIANKYMQTPQGTFEMKYFFTPGYTMADGQVVSNKSIKDAIADLVADEPPENPLSDQAMVEKLKEQGITVARRTIAKYRDELKILPSHLRKGFAK